MRLRAGLAVLWRGPCEVQVGTDPRWAVRLADLSPAAVRALVALGPDPDVREIRAALAAEEVDPAEAGAVLDHLAAAGVLVPPTARTLAGAAPADVRAWSLLDAAGDGSAALSRRTAAHVRVEGLGRVGAAIAATLALGGVGSLDPVDDGVVDRELVGFGGLAPEDVGTPRRAAVRRAVVTANPSVGVGRRASPPDLVVLVEAGAADPLRHAALVADDVAHLSVVVREASVLVGPLVVPGRTACLRCVDLHRTDADPGWPAVAAQLVARRSPRRRAPETTLATTSAAVAAAQALAHLDGRASVLHDGALEVALPLGLPLGMRWPPHPGCGCGGHRPASAP